MKTELTFTCCTPFSCGIKDNVGDTTKQIGKQTDKVLHIIGVSLCCWGKPLKSYFDLVVVDWTDSSYQSAISLDEYQNQTHEWIWCSHLNIRNMHSLKDAVLVFEDMQTNYIWQIYKLQFYCNEKWVIYKYNSFDYFLCVLCILRLYIQYGFMLFYCRIVKIYT